MNRYFATILILSFSLFVCLVCFQAKAQQTSFAFKAQIKPDTILIGDMVELTIFASVPKGYEVLFPFFADSLIQGIEVLGKPQIDTLKTKGDVSELLYRLAITSFDSGSYRIPGLQLPFSDGKMSDTATTTPMWLTVNTLPADTTKAPIYDIKPPLRQPYTFAELAPWIGGGLLLVGVIALIVLYFIRRKKDQPIFFPRKVQEPPHVIALRELEKIKEGSLWDTANSKNYHSLLTDIIRTYIEGRFSIPAMEQTTFEIVTSFKKAEKLSNKLLMDLEQTLTQADLVKFAKLITTANENKEGLEFGFRFVNETMIVEEQQENVDEEYKGIAQPQKAQTEKLPVEPVNNEEQ